MLAEVEAFNLDMMKRIGTCCSDGVTEVDNLHKGVNINYSLFRQSNDINALLSIFSCKKLLSIVEQIVKFAAINFVEGDENAEVLEAWLLCSKCVKVVSYLS